MTSGKMTSGKMKKSRYAADNEAICNALREWFISQNVGCEQAVDVANLFVARIIANWATDWPDLIDGLTHANAQIAGFAVAFAEKTLETKS